MPVFLDRIDSAPINNDEFSFDFNSWLSVMIDTLNEDILLIQNSLNGFNDGLIAPSFTTAQIAILALTAVNGTMWYNTDTNHLVAKINGVVVVVV
jgi:hypothetical protein